MVGRADRLGLRVWSLPHGATLIDAGIEAPGSLEAGVLFAEACLGGLGTVTLAPCDVVADLPLVAAVVTVAHPHVACLGSQYAGWRIRAGAFSAMGSGPARLLARVEALINAMPYQEHSEVAALLLEGRALPDDDVACDIAARCGVKPSGLTLAIAPTASIVGTVQVAARSVEAGLHKMETVGFPPEAVRSAAGVCPVAPVGADDSQTMGRVNDCLLYAGQAWYTVDVEDAAIERVLALLPASASSAYGLPFADLLRQAGDFYRVDPLLFSVAQIVITNQRSGRTFRAGGTNHRVLRASLLGAP
ncbi:MAG: methenyltetrahydromethanopterin cyclohydrolase [Armatimonadota bacterium]|nr:methenyltetrahydromethanopterin cyclohydrolase [Armatimonadota bacterium]